MRIATFNCNSVRARLPIITHWLKENNPDILALQEIKVETDKFPHEPFTELGYHCEVRGMKGYSGVAIICKTEPDEVNAGFRDGDSSEDSRILACRWGRLHVINTYCPQGRDPESEQFRYKLEWFRRLREMFDKFYTKRQRVLWLGDMNIAPEPIDVYDSKRIMGHVAHRPEVFEALEHVTDWGFIDLFRKFHPDEPGHFSYWDYRVINSLKRGMGWRVDHMFVTKSLAAKASGCRYDTEPRAMEKPSDHTFMLANFNL